MQKPSPTPKVQGGIIQIQIRSQILKLRHHHQGQLLKCLRVKVGRLSMNTTSKAQHPSLWSKCSQFWFVQAALKAPYVTTNNRFKWQHQSNSKAPSASPLAVQQLGVHLRLSALVAYTHKTWVLKAVEVSLTGSKTIKNMSTATSTTKQATTTMSTVNRDRNLILAWKSLG